MNGYVRVADGRLVDIAKAYELPIRIGRRNLLHAFQVMPGPEDEMIVGVDLWQKLGNWLPPPPSEGIRGMSRVSKIEEGLTPRTAEEDARLRCFLDKELARVLVVLQGFF